MSHHFSHQMPGSNIHLSNKELDIYVGGDKGHVMVNVRYNRNDGTVDNKELKERVEKAIQHADAFYYASPPVIVDVSVHDGDRNRPDAVLAVSQLDRFASIALAIVNDLYEMKQHGQNGEPKPLIARPLDLNSEEREYPAITNRIPNIKAIMRDQLQHAMASGHIDITRKLLMDGVLNLSPKVDIEPGQGVLATPLNEEKTVS